jgi:transcriptional regulator with XRE-family HTH domain
MSRGFCHEYEVDGLLDFIRGEMKRRKVTQNEAAVFLGMSQGMLSRKLKDGSLDVKELKALRILLEIPQNIIGGYL